MAGRGGLYRRVQTLANLLDRAGYVARVDTADPRVLWALRRFPLAVSRRSATTVALAAEFDSLPEGAVLVIYPPATSSAAGALLVMPLQDGLEALMALDPPKGE